MDTHKLIKFRNGALGGLRGKGILGRVLLGLDSNGNVTCWNLEGRYRWDGKDHPLDIVEGV